MTSLRGLVLLFCGIALLALGCGKSSKDENKATDDKDVSTFELPLASGQYVADQGGGLSITKKGNFILSSIFDVEYMVYETDGGKILSTDAASCRIQLQGKISFHSKAADSKAQKARLEIVDAKLIKSDESRWQERNKQTPEAICKRYISENMTAKSIFAYYDRFDSAIWLFMKNSQSQKLIDGKSEAVAIVPMSIYGSALFTKRDSKLDLSKRFFTRFEEKTLPASFKRQDGKTEISVDPTNSAINLIATECDYQMRFNNVKTQFLNGIASWRCEAKELTFKKGPNFNSSECDQEAQAILDRVKNGSLKFGLHISPSAFKIEGQSMLPVSLSLEGVGKEFYGLVPMQN